MHDATLYREVEDIYTQEDMIEVAIEVTFSIQPADHSCGIMCAYVEEVTVTSTDCALFDIDDAQAWIDGKTKDAEHAIERLHEKANEDDGEYLDYCSERDDRDYPAGCVEDY